MSLIQPLNVNFVVVFVIIGFIAHLGVEEKFPLSNWAKIEFVFGTVLSHLSIVKAVFRPYRYYSQCLSLSMISFDYGLII